MNYFIWFDIMKHKKHQNQVRIIGGDYRGRKLNFTSAEGLRPTPDMVREKLFNWLGQDLTGLNVLDLFGGSGALGFEAASRGANRVVVVENNRHTVQDLQQNCKLLGTDKIDICVSDGLYYLKQCHETFDVVFLDPPFIWSDWDNLFELLLARLNPNALIYLEAATLPVSPNWLKSHRKGKSGISHYELFHYINS